MSRHLSVEVWFVVDKQGRPIKGKRVTVAREAHFPKDLRRVYFDARPFGATALTKHLINTRGLSLSAAWAEVKRLFNESPGGL